MSPTLICETIGTPASKGGHPEAQETKRAHQAKGESRLVARIIVGIDVGTTKICTLIGQVDELELEAEDPTRPPLRIIGIGVVPARGMRKGVVTDLDAATKAVAESVDRAERVSGHTVTEAYVSVGGAHISSQNSRGVVAIGRGDRPVDREDIERAMEAAQAIAISHNRRIIHCIPREFVVDGQDGIKNPLGLLGYRLEVEAHIVTGALSSIQNLRKCIEANEIEIADLVLQPLATAEAVLTEEEKNMGVTVADIGGGTIDMAIHLAGSVWETLVHDVGGYQISNDIAVGLRTPFATAEELKVRYAHALPSAVAEGEVIEFSSFGSDSVTSISRRELCEIVALRVEEMLDAIAQDIRRSGLASLLPAGVVLAGGTANLRGLRDLAQKKLGVPVRIGAPRQLRGLSEAVSSPAYATAVGLLLWGMQQETSRVENAYRVSTGGTWFQQMLKWLRVLLPGT